MTEGHRVSRGRGRRGDTADTHPENVPRMILKYFLNMIIFSGLTFGPAGQHVAEVDDSVGGVVVGDGRALPLPEGDLVPEVPRPPGARLRVPAPVLAPAPGAHPRQFGKMKRNCPPRPPRSCALKLTDVSAFL